MQLDALNMPASFLERQVNYGFSVSSPRAALYGLPLDNVSAVGPTHAVLPRCGGTSFLATCCILFRCQRPDLHKASLMGSQAALLVC